VADVEDGAKETFQARRQLVRLLVAEVTVGKKPENGETEIRFSYRFGPPPVSGSGGSPSQGACLVMLSRTVESPLDQT
jgi:hypothetical protein